MRRTWNRARTLAAVTALSLAAMACGGDGDEDPTEPSPDELGSEEAGTDAGAPDDFEALVAAAQEEGELTLYHATAEEDTREWVAAFTEEYGITVNHFRAATGPLYERWLQETATGQHIADAALLSDLASWVEARDNGLVAEFVPESADQLPAEHSLEGYFYPIYYYVMALTWNTDALDDDQIEMLESDGLTALADPAFRDEIAVLVPQCCGAPHAELDRIANDSRYGWELLEQIAANNPTFYESTSPLNDRLVAGEHGVALMQNDTLAAPSALAGAPIRWKYDDLATAVPFGIGVSENAPNPNAARLFANWATSEAGVANMMRIRQGLPANTAVTDDREIVQQDWYQPPAELYLDWSVNAELHDAREEFYEQFNTVMGYTQ